VRSRLTVQGAEVYTMSPTEFAPFFEGERKRWAGVVAKGNHFEVYHNAKKLYEVEDETFKEAGKVGLWTKADSVIYFDDLQITAL